MDSPVECQCEGRVFERSEIPEAISHFPEETLAPQAHLSWRTVPGSAGVASLQQTLLAMTK